MVIRLSKFGTLLISRPAGKEAYLAAKSYLLSPPPKTIEIDFRGVKVVTPSWLDEFVTPLRHEYPDRLKLLPSANPTVVASLETISQ